MEIIKLFLRIAGLCLLAILLILIIPSLITGIDMGPFDLLNWQEIKRNGLFYILYYLLNIIVAALVYFYFKRKKWALYLVLILVLNFPCISTEYYYFCSSDSDRFMLSKNIEEEDHFTLRYNILSNYLWSGMAMFKTPGQCEYKEVSGLEYPAVVGASYSLGVITRYEDSAVYFMHVGCCFVLSICFFLCLLWNWYFSKKQGLMDIEERIKRLEDDHRQE